MEREVIGFGLVWRYALVAKYDGWPYELRFRGLGLRRHRHPLADQVKPGDSLRKMLKRVRECELNHDHGEIQK